MPEKTSHVPGTFCWFELATTDQNGARSFYTSLFSWSADDMPMGPDSTYTMLKLRGKEVGALYGMLPEMRAQHVPPHWLTYVAVGDVDASAQKAKQLGGTTMADPFDVYDIGRMCVVLDPQGAAFALWQAKTHIGVGLTGEPGTACWCELETKDIEAAKRFYGGLLGWEGKTSTGDGMAYTEWELPGVGPFGGMMEIPPEWGPVPPHWMTYFQVEDCDACVAKATGLGATVRMGPMDIPKVGRFAVLADPQGAVFSVIRLLPMP